MSNLDLLHEQVEGGDLRIIQMVSVPRSASTALGRALNESEPEWPSVFINEPFQHGNGQAEVAARHILNVAKQAIQKKQRPLTVITKNSANNIPPPAFRAMSEVAGLTVWTVRNPLTQMGSLLTHLANGSLDDDAQPTDFSETGWAAMRDHFNGQASHEDSVIIDGGELTANPERVLMRACRRLRFPYSQRTLTGWQQAYASSRVGPVAQPPLQLDDLPAALQKHISEVAIPTYQTILATA